ncbi:hypothetical protein B7463_g7544, partial [Scytalidium lignicola]
METQSMSRPLVPGVYVPTTCFFTKDREDVDISTIAKHAVRLARVGVTGVATQGSNGEAVHLTRSERQLVTATTRRALDNNGFGNMPIIVGCGAQSTHETIRHCRDAHEAGGDYALILPPSYYASLFAPAAETLLDYFTVVANRSPIPLILHNFPLVASGLDLSSDVIIKIAQHPNILGVKLTCGNLGKLNRVVNGTRSLQVGPHNRQFLVFSGSAESLLQSLAGGGHGVIGGLANIAPKACVKVMELYQQGKISEAQEIQAVVSNGDWAAIQGGIVGVKAGLQGWVGYGGYARSPLPKPTEDEAVRWTEAFRDLMILEVTM